MPKTKAALATGGAAAILILALTLFDPTGSRAATDAPPASATPSVAATPTSMIATTTADPSVTTQATRAKKQTAAAQTLAVLDTLAVKGRAPKTGYKRTQFGPAWADNGTVEGSRNGCGTRDDILKRDLSDVRFKPGTRNCVVVSGTLKNDPYTGKTIPFKKGASSADIQIEHVVALSDAWQKGAQQLSPQERLNFANDPRHLLAVDGPTNGKKGDADAASWLPPNRAFRCQYVTLQVQIKKAYRLWVTKAEKAAIAKVLSSC